MITFILLGIILLLLLTHPVTFYRGKSIGSAAPKAIEYRHEHIWSPWKDHMLAYHDKNGKPLYKESAQARLCDECGYRDIRKLQVS